MRKLFTLCLLVFTLSASAQWQQTGSKVRYVNGLGIPTRDTAAGIAADSSQILIRPQDSALYVKYKRTWLRVGGGGGSIAGSGTTNYIPKFTSSSAIGNSQIFDNGTNVGIGTTSPAERLELVGNILASGSAGLYPRFISTVGAKSWEIGYRSGTTNYEIREDGNTRMVIANGGNVGIGTTSPSEKLHLVGNTFKQNDASNSFGYTISTTSATTTLATLFGGSSFGIRTGGSGSDNMRITSGGDVGIGTTSPAGRFVVADGQTLLGTNTNNGVDRLQVSGSALITAGLQAATTSGNVSLRTTATTYPFNISLGANAGIGMYQDGTTATLIGTNQTVSATAPLQILGTTLTLNASGNNNAQIFTNSNERLRVNGTGNVIVDPGQLGTKLLVNTTTDAGTDRVQVAGSISAEGFKQRYLARTTAYTATTSDYLIDCTTGTFTVTLYAASGNAGRILIVKNSGTGSITVDGNGAETIDGAATQTLGTQWSRISIMCDGANWKIISN